MTEDEAKKLPCIRVSAAALDMNGPCRGSSCLAWRWQGWERADLPVGMEAPEGYEKHGPPRGEGGAVTNRQEWRRRNEGYCGFIGPQT